MTRRKYIPKTEDIGADKGNFYDMGSDEDNRIYDLCRTYNLLLGGPEERDRLVGSLKGMSSKELMAVGPSIEVSEAVSGLLHKSALPTRLEHRPLRGMYTLEPHVWRETPPEVVWGKHASGTVAQKAGEFQFRRWLLDFAESGKSPDDLDILWGMIVMDRNQEESFLEHPESRPWDKLSFKDHVGFPAWCMRFRWTECTTSTLQQFRSKVSRFEEYVVPMTYEMCYKGHTIGALGAHTIKREKSFGVYIWYRLLIPNSFQITSYPGGSKA